MPLEQATQAKIVVPTDEQESEAVIDELRRAFTKQYGGCTTIRDASGDWHDKTMDRVVSEDVAVVSCTSADMSEEFVERQAQYVKNTLHQDAVLCLFNDVTVGLV